MTRLSKISYLIVMVTCLAFVNTFTGDAQGAFTCSTGASDPPFLSAGVDPNLLILIDNSASMYDMAYVADEGGCYDGSEILEDLSEVDSYDESQTYAGYFANDTWYDYDNGQSRFEVGAVPATCPADAVSSPDASVAYYRQYSGAYEICTKITTVGGITTVTLGAKGNFLNWATASKFDVQKQILTGGKYDDTNDLMILEGRGCSGSRFIKQVRVYETGPGTQNYLIFGIHPLDEGTDNTTAIDIFQINETGFDFADCQEAIDEMADPDTILGQLKAKITDCMEYANNQSYGDHGGPAFNQAVQTCWWWDKHGYDGDHSHATSLQNQCEQLYDTIDPGAIDPTDPGYVCYGEYQHDIDVNDPDDKGGKGYAGRCWIPASGGAPLTCDDVDCKEVGGVWVYTATGLPLPEGERCTANPGLVEYCTGNFNAKQGTCNKPWELKEECTGGGGGTPAGWAGVDKDAVEECILRAQVDFCGSLELPEVVDPTDLTMSTGEVWNLPAMLTDVGAYGQLGDPLVTLKGNIYETTTPTGLLHEFADDIRMGAMKFNHDGSDSECDKPDPYITYACDEGGNKDGGQVIQEIGKNSATTPDHTDDLVAQINAIVADSWTPIAEAFFTAIGYFTQRDALRHHGDDDFKDVPVDEGPCTHWCQNNNVLIITEGASTADLSDRVTNFATTVGQKDPNDTDDPAGCGALYGSTFLDDLAYYAWNIENIFLESPYDDEEHYQPIKTFIVVAGTPRDEGAGECSPKTLLENAAANGGTTAPYVADNPQELEDKLKTVFNLIRAGAAAGSAASVISATRGGEGAIYQAIFWPSVDGPEDKPVVAWTGEVHSMLIDAYGVLYEDTNGDHALTYDTDGNITDAKVVLYYDTTDRVSKACYGDVDNDGNCSGTSKSLSQVKYLWSAAEWLADISDADIIANRTTYISSAQKRRYIFSWNDVDNDGIVDYGAGLDDDEVISFVSNNDWTAGNLAVSGGRAPIPLDFGVTTSAEVNKIVEWVRGEDTLADATLRPREVPTPANFSISGAPATVTWRLGDVVHSTPTAVARPAEGYQFLFKDISYAKFANRYQARRHVIYFGANDGMVHAINSGFYEETSKKFWRNVTIDAEGYPTGYSDTGPALGAELWAYVPYNLLPHLKCLTEPGYAHKYFVDLKPRVFDVNIFSPDTDHPEGWGTILVVGMRFGGARVTAQDLDTAGTYPGDTRVFTSSYVILDITNPEIPPTLLGELTYEPGTSADMAYTASVPSVVPMKDGTDYKWYLVLGSGPTEITGVSNQNAIIGVFPLDLLTVSGPQAFQIPIPPATPEEDVPGSWELANSANGFVSDSIAVDYDLVEDYKADAVYFGTVEGTWGAWDGKMYRLVTYEDTPDGWEDPNNTLLIDTGRPIISAASVGYDDENYWIYFGSGRFFDKKDKNDGGPNDDGSNAWEGFYGIKEPMDQVGEFTWAEVQRVLSTANDQGPGGQRNILRVDQIEVTAAASAPLADVTCKGGGVACLPGGVTKFDQLLDHVVGTGCTAVDNCTGSDGWYLQFDEERERNLGQGALLGGLMTFTTYQPFDDVCKPEGEAFLYGVYFQTGTGWYEAVFTTQEGGGTEGDPPKVTTKLAIGRGLATTPNLHVGRQEGSKAFVQTSTGTIVEIPQPNLPIKTTKSGRMSWRSE